MRRLAARVHLWGGLLSAPLLLVLGLSGSVLVFAPEIEHALDGRPVRVTPPSAAPPSLDAVVAAALVAEPGAAPRALRLPPRPGEPFVVELAVGGHRLDAAVDGATLRVVDVRAPERSPLVAVRSLHAALHAGRAGALLVGLLGLWLVVEGVTGLWLYGPSIARRVRGRSRVVHRVVGGGALIVGAIVGFTGALLVSAAVASVGTAPVSAARLTRLDFVTTRVPAEGRVVALLAEPAHRVRVEMRRPDGGLDSLVVDADTGSRVAAAAPRDAGTSSGGCTAAALPAGRPACCMRRWAWRCRCSRSPASCCRRGVTRSARDAERFGHDVVAAGFTLWQGPAAHSP